MSFWDPNQFKAHAPVNNFQANQAGLDQSSFANAIMQAQQQALGGNAQANQTAGMQTSLAQALMAQANGQGPSLAQMQLQQATQQNAAQGAGAIASQRGINPALAARMILQQQAQGNQQAAGQSGMLRMQEQMQARDQLGQVLAQQRGQDIGQQQANTGLFGTAGQLQQGQNSNMIQNAGMAQGINAQVAQGNQAANLQAQGINAGVAANNADFHSKIIGGALGGIGSVAGMAIGKASGGPIPGQAAMPGDSPRNDTVPAALSPGEIVLPRSVTQSPDAAEKAKTFVEAIKAKKETTPEEGYGRLLQKHRELNDRIARLEAFACGGMVR